MSRKVFVSNIPVRACVDGWVTVPDDTTPESLSAAVVKSLREDGYEPETIKIDPSETELDRSYDLSLWEFSYPLEKT